MSELQEKVQKSIERLKAFENVAMRHADDGQKGYYLAFSGGKDSVAVKALADLAGVPYDAHYRLTSVDPPELVRFIKDKHPDVHIDIPRYETGPDEGKQITMWNLIQKKKYPPTRLARYCCEFLKEDGGDGRMCITGVRWAESVNRKNNQGVVTVYGGGKSLADEFGDSRVFTNRQGGVVLTNDNEDARQVVDACVTRHKTVLNPIIDWTDREVWDFIHAEKIPYCELYNEGFHRLGCIGCPMARRHGRERDFARWPKYKQAYIHAFEKMMKIRKEQGLTSKKVPWETAQDVFNWWMEYDILPGQTSFFDEEGEDE